ncbi:MAG: helix-hairpin-helix domain-containing protein [Candidatus Thorarchaeota archaeon]|nr:helix-hairpin-helix domain-containing protein [Candidatus Thorarchaeota archaeon]
MSSNISNSQFDLLAIVSIAIFVIIGIALWWYNTVAALLILLLSFSAGALILWRTISKSIEQKSGFSGNLYREREITRRRLSDIENRMRRALEAGDVKHDNMIEDFNYANLEGESIADYDTEIPVEIIDGIQNRIIEHLEGIGIEDLDELAVADPEEISKVCGISSQIVEEWILDAKAIFVGAHISSIITLSMEDAKKMQSRISKSAKSGTLKMPVDYKITLPKVQRWINRANKIVSTVDVNEMQRWLEDGERKT